jgi:multisubunit Na+/H+ antiporter MnhC subunit
MNAEWIFFIHYGLVSLVILTGLYGVFSQNDLWKKLMAWGVFQTGIILLLISTAEKTEVRPPLLGGQTPGILHGLNPLPHALVLSVLMVSLVVVIVLAFFTWSLFRETGQWDEEMIDEEISK